MFISTFKEKVIYLSRNVFILNNYYILVIISKRFSRYILCYCIKYINLLCLRKTIICDTAVSILTRFNNLRYTVPNFF